MPGRREDNSAPQREIGTENAEIDRLVMKPTARRRLGKYVLLGRLGHGGMGKIYLGYAPGPAGIEKLLVVKRLHGHLTSDPVLVNSFLDEARLSMALNHPNIVHTYDVGDVDGRYFMVMEYIEGQNLGVVLRTAKRSGQYPSSALWASLFLPVLDALHHAHNAKDARGRALQIIHRDVSPQNILVTYDGLPKLVDFGIAKAAMRVSETDAGVLKGKYAYMSPEQVKGDVALDPRSDVFAAGVVLWEMLAGRRLYKAETIVRSVERILTEPVISPTRVNPDCDAEIAKIAFKALQKDREQRFKSALDMRDSLEEAMRKSGKLARQSDARELMTRLFGDVIARQHAVLEQCLGEADKPAPEGGDDDEKLPKRPSDSESDVSSKSLSAQRDKSEITTPSSVRASPLVTGEGEKLLDERNEKNAPTSLERRKRDASAATPGDLRAGDPMQTTSAQSQRSRAPLLAAAFAIVVVLVACAAFLAWRFGFGETRAPVAVAPVAPAPAAPVAPAPSTPPPTPAPVTAAPATTTAPAPVPIAPIAPIAATAKAETKPQRPEPRLAPEPKRTAAAGAKKKPLEETKKAEAPVVEEKASGEQQGLLSLDTVPWTVVYLGKRKLGETPLVKVPVPAGALELTLVNPDENLREQYIANVKPNAEFRERLDLH